MIRVFVSVLMVASAATSVVHAAEDRLGNFEVRSPFTSERSVSDTGDAKFQYSMPTVHQSNEVVQRKAAAVKQPTSQFPSGGSRLLGIQPQDDVMVNLEKVGDE